MSKTKTLKIRELDLHAIRPRSNTIDEYGSKIAIVGKPGSGKSYLLRDLIWSKSGIIPTGKVVSGTEDSNSFFSKMFPSLMIDEKLEIDAIKNFIKRQKIAKKYIPEHAWAYLILDDCMDDPALFRNAVFQNVMKNGRHWKMLMFLCMQYAMDILPSLRICIDGTFIFREANPRFRKILFENYAGIFGDFKLFCAAMDQITDDHTALYIDNTSNSNNIEDCVFWYKARETPDFKVGCEDYWLFHRERYDENHPPLFG
jgi:hypothetical protein